MYFKELIVSRCNEDAAVVENDNQGRKPAFLNGHWSLVIGEGVEGGGKSYGQ